MYTYKVPTYYMVYGTVEVEAESDEELMLKLKDRWFVNSMTLPLCAEFVEDSFEIDFESLEEQLEEIADNLDGSVKQMKNTNKLFKCNTEITQVAEWCIAKNKHEAYVFMNNFWDSGLIMYDFYVSEYLELNPGKTIEDFIDYFFIEEDPESDFTMPPQDTFELAITKKVHEWIEEAPDNKPIYLCHEEW